MMLWEDPQISSYGPMITPKYKTSCDKYVPTKVDLHMRSGLPVIFVQYRTERCSQPDMEMISWMTVTFQRGMKKGVMWQEFYALIVTGVNYEFWRVEMTPEKVVSTREDGYPDKVDVWVHKPSDNVRSCRGFYELLKGIFVMRRMLTYPRRDPLDL